MDITAALGGALPDTAAHGSVRLIEAGLSPVEKCNNFCPHPLQRDFSTIIHSHFTQVFAQWVSKLYLCDK
jgi:hypothetical protein